KFPPYPGQFSVKINTLIVACQKESDPGKDRDERDTEHFPDYGTEQGNDHKPGRVFPTSRHGFHFMPERAEA
ncbi:hypothetical protein, partial [Komagataeibacter xylinus]|uniref:hypothetical protein n=1 Tax=Komagataeibacter xylinus TaxID=28448 RepID=UPI002230B79E